MQIAERHERHSLKMPEKVPCMINNLQNYLNKNQKHHESERVKKSNKIWNEIQYYFYKKK